MKPEKQFKRKMLSMIREDVNAEFPAFLGNHSGVVATGSAGMVYVTLIDGSVLSVYNGRTQNVSRLPVMIGFAGGKRLQVVRSRDVFPEVPYPDIASHAQLHSFPNSDTVPVRGEQFIPGLVEPASGLTVRVHGMYYELSNGWSAYATQTLDLSSYIPAAGALYALIEVDSAGVLSVTSGTAVDSRAVLEYSDIPTGDAEKYRLAAVKLYAEQTSLIFLPTDTDIIDLRWGRHSKGSPGGNDTNIQFNDGGAFGGEDTFIRQANGAIVIGDIDPALAIEAYSLGQGADGTSIANFLETFGTGVASYIALLRARGTHDAPTAIMDDDVIGRIRGRGHDGTGWTSTRAELRIVADGDWAAGDHPTRIELWTCPDDSDILTLAMTIGNDGSVTLPEYGGGAITGTAAYGLAVDSAGKIIETTASGGGGAFQRVLTANLSLADGESLVIAEYIDAGDYDLTLNGDAALNIL